MILESRLSVKPLNSLSGERFNPSPLHSRAGSTVGTSSPGDHSLDPGWPLSRSVEVNLCFFQYLFLLLKVVPEPGYVLLLLAHGQVRVVGQAHQHQLHEVANGALAGEALLQMPLQEHVLMEGNASLLLQPCETETQKDREKERQTGRKKL